MEPVSVMKSTKSLLITWTNVYWLIGCLLSNGWQGTNSMLQTVTILLKSQMSQKCSYKHIEAGNNIRVQHSDMLDKNAIVSEEINTLPDKMSEENSLYMALCNSNVRQKKKKSCQTDFIFHQTKCLVNENLNVITCRGQFKPEQNGQQYCKPYSIRADSRLAPSQWETALQSNAVSHWLGANLE